MILPILRLVLIYFLLVAGVVAVFNRDKLAPLLPGGRDRAATTETAPETAPTPLAQVPVSDAPSPDASTTASGGAAQPGLDSGPNAGPDAGLDAGATGPVFPESSELDAAAGTANDSAAGASAAQVTPAPGIAPDMPPLQPTPTDNPATAAGESAAGESVAAEGQHAAAPTATETAANASPQPAKPGSPASLGTPVATAPETAAAATAAPTAPQTSADAPAAGTPAQNTVAPTPAPAPTPMPGASAALTAPTPAQNGAPANGSDATAAPTTALTAAPATTLADAIGAARSTYWAGDIEGARAQMDALAAAHPDNADVAGELGNLAFALRDYPAAAEAWYRAGVLLIEQGEPARVMSFLPFLQSIAPEKAAALAARLKDR